MSKRVLLADDNCDGAETLGMFLETLNHEVQLPTREAEALELVLDMSGYEVAIRIRLEAWGRRSRSSP